MCLRKQEDIDQTINKLNEVSSECLWDDGCGVGNMGCGVGNMRWGIWDGYCGLVSVVTVS